MVGQVVVAVETAAEGLAPPCRAYFLPILTHLLAVKGSSSACHSLELLLYLTLTRAFHNFCNPGNAAGRGLPSVHIQGHGDYTVLTSGRGCQPPGTTQPPDRRPLRSPNEAAHIHRSHAFPRTQTHLHHVHVALVGHRPPPRAPPRSRWRWSRVCMRLCAVDGGDVGARRRDDNVRRRARAGEGNIRRHAAEARRAAAGHDGRVGVGRAARFDVGHDRGERVVAGRVGALCHTRDRTQDE